MESSQSQNKSQGSDFYQQIYDLVALIPEGRVTSYGAIAKALGRPGAARQVGYAMNGCHAIHPNLPAHRVVNRIGVLTGKHHFADEQEMERLLTKEGIIVANDTILNFEAVFWNPETELI